MINLGPLILGSGGLCYAKASFACRICVSSSFRLLQVSHIGIFANTFSENLLFRNQPSNLESLQTCDSPFDFRYHSALLCSFVIACSYYDDGQSC